MSLVVFDCVCGWGVLLVVLAVWLGGVAEGVVWGVAGGVRSRIWVGSVVLGGGLACFWWGVN